MWPVIFVLACAAAVLAHPTKPLKEHSSHSVFQSQICGDRPGQLHRRQEHGARLLVGDEARQQRDAHRCGEHRRSERLRQPVSHGGVHVSRRDVRRKRQLQHSQPQIQLQFGLVDQHRVRHAGHELKVVIGSMRDSRSDIHLRN